jgi:hypothetical protein
MGSGGYLGLFGGIGPGLGLVTRCSQRALTDIFAMATPHGGQGQVPAGDPPLLLDCSSIVPLLFNWMPSPVELTNNWTGLRGQALNCERLGNQAHPPNWVFT